MNKYVKIAKRDNNSKRNFLIVNPFLGKHIPANPNDILNMFDKLSELHSTYFNPDKTLVIGFAETATAIGLHYAIKNNCFFMQTTREEIMCKFTNDYIYFSEEHSHATTQKISASEFIGCVGSNNIENIIFIDDEITTGKTILNAIDAISKLNISYGLKYSVISILNGMTNEEKDKFQQKGIFVDYLENVDKDGISKISNDFSNNGNYFKSEDYINKIQNEVTYFTPYQVMMDTRYKILSDVWNIALEFLCNQIDESCCEDIIKDDEILVLGVEEFMYPSIIFGKYLQDKYNCEVKCHSTTRSPIMVSTDESYPLYKRYEFKSVYDNERKTYIYNLKKYTKIFLFVEMNYSSSDMINDLLKILDSNKIMIIQVRG